MRGQKGRDRALKLAARLQELLDEAKQSGLAFVVDAEDASLRIISAHDSDSGKDLRDSKYTLASVKVHNACGSSIAKVNGDACNFGV